MSPAPEHQPQGFRESMRDLVDRARKGVRIEGEFATSEVVAEVRRLAEEGLNQCFNTFLDATNDEDRREAQLIGRSYKNTLDLLGEVQAGAANDIKTLEQQESVDASALEQPDT